MAEEFRKDGIAVNALWPRTAIDTEAIRLIAGDEARMKTRLPAILADAAHIILTKPSHACTGGFFIDDEVLREAGVTDFSQYQRAGVTDADLMPDFFV
jgi:citronellol/citronellal dehydrogenase